MRWNKGFTLVEILTVVMILTVVSTAAIVVIRPSEWYERARTAKARASLLSMVRAAELYSDKYDTYPPDVLRNVAPDFVMFMNPGGWPGGPFPGSVYDWDNWESETCWDGTQENIQVTLRQINDYKGKTDYTFYAVIQGPGVPECHTPTVKGECINCLSRYP